MKRAKATIAIMAIKNLIAKDIRAGISKLI
jgi:hypothetical protein